MCIRDRPPGIPPPPQRPAPGAPLVDVARPPLPPGRPPASATAPAPEAPDSAWGRTVARWQPSA
eukprot:4819661-Alexandrium_andersonii.AAC.1